MPKAVAAAWLGSQHLGHVVPADMLSGRLPPCTSLRGQYGPVFEKPAGLNAGKPQFPSESAHGDNSPRPEPAYPALTSAPDQGTQRPTCMLSPAAISCRD